VQKESIKGWLEDWVERNLQSLQYHENKSTMSGDAVTCRRDAQEAGYSSAELDRAAGGDLESYLMRAQNVLTDAEVRSKVESDKD
jgi:hypothetical protein